MNKSKKILFLCTGNFYRSRFAEYYFNHFASNSGWVAESRGLKIDVGNIGPISSYVVRELNKLGIIVADPRFPIPAENKDFQNAQKIIALDKSEHEPMIKVSFPEWQNEIIYWNIGDMPSLRQEKAVPLMEHRLKNLINSLL